MRDDRPVLLLDVMDTLVHEPFHEELPRLFGLTPDGLVARLHPTSWIEFEEGRIDEDEFLARWFRDGRAVDRDAVHACLRASYRWLDGMQPLLAELRARGLAMHALSNYSVWYRLIEDELLLSRYLAWSFVSCEMGVRKPDRRAFEIALDRLGVAPERCVFVDDRTGNLEAAARLGIRPVHATGADAVRAALVALRVLEDGR